MRSELANLIGMITNVQDDYVMVMPENRTLSRVWARLTFAYEFINGKEFFLQSETEASVDEIEEVANIARYTLLRFCA